MVQNLQVLLFSFFLLSTFSALPSSSLSSIYTSRFGTHILFSYSSLSLSSHSPVSSLKDMYTNLLTVAAKKYVSVVGVKPIGNYAVQVHILHLRSPSPPLSSPLSSLPFPLSLPSSSSPFFLIYFIQLLFDDRHETGIYSWDLLYDLGQNKWAVMRRYLTEMKKWGRKRVPRESKKKEEESP